MFVYLNVYFITSGYLLSTTYTYPIIHRWVTTSDG